MWSLFRWVWRLDSPLYVGMPPAGTLNRCRLYVPARAVWAALTAELARAGAASFPDYGRVGERLREGLRFTYLFPAEMVGGRWLAWLPSFQPRQGLVWEREGGGAKLMDRRLRRRLLDTRPGTAINPGSDSAEEGSLRETECVQARWRAVGSFGESQVGLAGYMFLAGAGPGGEVEPIVSLWIGGDTRYGLGSVRRIECSEAGEVYGCAVALDGADPGIDTSRILAHGRTDPAAIMRGARELVMGWNAGVRRELGPEPLWVPGSCAAEPVRWRIGSDGAWRCAGTDGVQ